MKYHQLILSAGAMALIGSILPAYAASPENTTEAQAAPASTPQPEDAALTGKVSNALRADSVLAGYMINVESKGGVVRLSGTVKSDSDKRYASALVSTIDGVKSVKNDIGLL